LHPVILGPLLILCGVVGLFHSPSYSWHQLEAGILIAVGIPMFAHGVKKLNRPDDGKSPAERTAKRIADEAAPPNYANYSEAQLRQVLRRIDKERFPERVEEIRTRLAGFEAAQRKPMDHK